MPRVAQVAEVPGVADAIATRDALRCAERVARILRGGADRVDVARTAALVAARQFAPALPPPHGLLALSASLDLAAMSDPPGLPLIQACALVASEPRGSPPAKAKHAVVGDELHLGRSFLIAARSGDAAEADAIFSGILREGEERRLAGDVLFEACEQDASGSGHKLTFAVGLWRLARALGWLQGPQFLRPAVHLAVATPRDYSEYGATMREVGRSRLDLELAGRNVAPIDDVARNGFTIALGVGTDRLVQEVINGLKRGRAASGYADMVATTGMEHLVRDPAALETALYGMAARFVIGFSRTSAHILGVLQAARAAGRLGKPAPIEPPRMANEDSALEEMKAAIEGGDARAAAGLALGLADAGERVVRVLTRLAAVEDAQADGGHRLLYAAWALGAASFAPAPAYASLAAVLARGPKSRTIAAAV